MDRTGTFVSLSRNQLGPDPEIQHRPKAVDMDGIKYVASCVCGWKSGRRREQLIAVDSLLAHIAQHTVAAENVDAAASVG